MRPVVQMQPEARPVGVVTYLTLTHPLPVSDPPILGPHTANLTVGVGARLSLVYVVCTFQKSPFQPDATAAPMNQL